MKEGIRKDSFLKTTMRIAVPVAIQAMLQSSFSMIDQIMVGQLGTTQVAAVEIGSKPGFIFTFVSGAIATVAGIMISQYLGKKDQDAVQRSLSVNLLAMILLATAFISASLLLPEKIAAIYSTDGEVILQAGDYIRTLSVVYLFSGISSILAVQIRCMNYAVYPMYISAGAAVVNTALNWLLIFGKLNFPAMGIRGAALASVISQLVNVIMMIAVFLRLNGMLQFSLRLGKQGWQQYFVMLLPVVFNEFLWTIGQNVNTYIYGHMGTGELAAMSLTGPVQGFLIGALSGISQAAGIIIGKRLGEKEYEQAYRESKKLCFYGAVGAVALSGLLILLRGAYTGLYQVETQVRETGASLLLSFAILAPIKVENMILGGGIIRSGGRTKYIMIIDMCGTWLIGVPLGLFTGMVLHLPIFWVYFILSQEELFRLVVSIFMFRSRKWMNTLQDIS